MDWGDKDGVDSHDARMQVMGGFKWFAEQKGYKPGWSSFQFERMYGCKPNGEAMAAPAAPTHGVVLWIEKRNAQFGREMRAKGVKWVPRNGRK